MTRTFYEFFAGGGMARAGLGAGWRCLFANDCDRAKAAAYRRNWGADDLVCADVRALSTADLPGCADLAWASFPCQDLSLAGRGAGLAGARSGAFWPFRNLAAALAGEGRAPAAIALENVRGAVTSHGGKDFAAICEALRTAGYRCGALIVDAVLFVPQSRPRLFVFALRADIAPPRALAGDGPRGVFHPPALRRAWAALPPAARENWVWWRLAPPPPRNMGLADLIERNPRDAAWRAPEDTARLVAMMSPVNAARLRAALQSGERAVGAVYKRTRQDKAGRRVQRAEVRFDNIAGCLRVPGGGSSRQTLLVVENGAVRSRLLSGRETARLMGLPDEYALSANYNEAYRLTGDGVVVPVVRHLARELIEPALAARAPARAAA